MESFKVISTLGQADWQALLQALDLRIRERMRSEGSVFSRWLPFLAPVLLGATLSLVVFAGSRRITPEAVLVASVLIVAFILLRVHLRRRFIRPTDEGIFIGRTEFDFTPGGFEVTRATTRTHIAWSQLRDVSHTVTHVFLWVDQISAYVFRVADLPAPVTAEAAIARMRAFMAAAARAQVQPGNAAAAVGPADSAPGPADATVTPAPALAARPAPVSNDAPPSLRQELSALWRLEWRRMVDAAHLYGRDLTICLLALLSFGLWSGLDRLDYGVDAEFTWYGLGDTATLVAAALLLGWVLSRASTPRLPLRRSLLMVAACSPIVVLGAWLAPRMDDVGGYVVTVLALTWIFDLLHRGLRLMTGTRQLRAVFATLVCFGLLFLVFSQLYYTPELWYEPEQEDGESDESAAAHERLLFDQATRIDAEVAAMQAPDPARSAMWFVGFAGFGDQRVFAEEIETAAVVVRAKYHTTGRQLLLVNDRRDEEKYPFATVEALRHALQALGQRMNPEKDVLFLALSSHGSADATLSVSNDARMFWRDLSAPELRAMLDESGIRWRIVVVSACYSGSFIEALKDARTIVLTAAARDRTSFGCADDRDLTYFGEAFYRDALPDAPSLRAAFETARESIYERERVEGMDASDPQAHFGAQLEKKLTGMGMVKTVPGEQSGD